MVKHTSSGNIDFLLEVFLYSFFQYFKEADDGMHPNVRKFIQDFEEQALKTRSPRKKLGHLEVLCLEHVWGPVLDYHFEGLTAEYPFTDYMGRQRYVDFLYTRIWARIITELDGMTTHVRNISKNEFDDHLERQNDLVIAGYDILRFSANHLENNPQLCQRQLLQLLGRRFQIHHLEKGNSPNIWSYRIEMIQRYAMNHSEQLRATEVAAYFATTRHTAARWLAELYKRGLLNVVKSDHRVKYYTLK